MSKYRSVLLVGGPNAGKSNFLSRLWLSLQARSGCLQSDGMPHDAEYVNAGAESLLKGQFVGRTSREVHAQNVIPVRSVHQDGYRGELVIPDCSGEQWMVVHRSRGWDERWESVIPTVCGCLLFVRAGSDEIHAPLDWFSLAEIFATPSVAPDADHADTVELPTQVVLVDWAQCIREALNAHGAVGVPLRVGVVVTAWDRVPIEQQKKPPVDWVADNFPMLHDFALSNPAEFTFEYFGTSVAGDDFENSLGFRERYLQGEPEKAGYVCHALEGRVEQTSDYSLSVAWAMGLDVKVAQAGAGST